MTLAALQQLQDGQEGDDELYPGTAGPEDIDHRRRPRALAKPVDDAVHTLVDAIYFMTDMDFQWLLWRQRRIDGPEGFIKGIPVNRTDEVVLPGHGRAGTVEHEAALIPKAAHSGRESFHALIFDELADQHVLRVFFVLVSRLRRLRQEQPRFNLQERRCHDEELASIIDIEAIELPDVFIELVRNRHNRDVVDVDLVLFDQVQEQVERTLEIRYRVFVFTHKIAYLIL